MKIIDGRKLQEEILATVQQGVTRVGFAPVFTDVLVGDDPASAQYVRMKARMAERVGIRFHNASFPGTITMEDLIKEIKILNKIPNMCGIIIQLPLPASLDKRAILDAIEPELDVDCLGTSASLEFYSGKIDVGFPTALACMALLDSLQMDLKDKKIVVLGQGDLVGKPVAALLRFRGLHPDIVTRKVENKEQLLKEADVIISGIGKGKYLTGDMVKQGVVLIDAGTSESNGGIVGDIDLESVKDVASHVSPVPGGVGPVTVAMLLSNVLKEAQKIK
jgi:methylenetetrahydrofolate dehydrogenase (NADP+)/methenyltetrahydrofolate cyclohydrolase